MAIKDRLRELLDAKGMKPADLARMSGTSESMISFYLSGKREPMGKTCFKLASALGVSVDELLDTGMTTQKERPVTTAGDESNISDIQKEAIRRIQNASEPRAKELLKYLDFLESQDNQDT